MRDAVQGNTNEFSLDLFLAEVCRPSNPWGSSEQFYEIMKNYILGGSGDDNKTNDINIMINDLIDNIKYNKDANKIMAAIWFGYNSFKF